VVRRLPVLVFLKSKAQKSTIKMQETIYNFLGTVLILMPQLQLILFDMDL
jgi:urate oxidase